MRDYKYRPNDNVKTCIRYIQDCGYTFEYYNKPWYVFRHHVSRREMVFTLSELRHACQYGW